ncbi:hypothetical protein [Streptomyces chrestomyceticus]|uniref:hypothetical protein n=1 Tax=Streptomyces chrestomyceticus TaxID=68185 RepID=UPI0033E7C0A9
MIQTQVGSFRLKVNPSQVEAGLVERYRMAASGEGTFNGIPVVIVFDHTGQVLPDGSEIATSNGFLRAKEGCDVAFTVGVGGFQCDPDAAPGALQGWQGAVALKSRTPNFRELNGKVFWVEVSLDPQGESVHRWFTLQPDDD